MIEWKPNEKIATGVMRIMPEHKERYGKTCRDEIIKTVANEIMKLPSRIERANRLEKVPKTIRDDVRILIINNWRKENA